MGAAQSTYLNVKQHQDEQRRKQSQKFAESKRGQRALNSKRTQKYIKKREETLQKGADLRLAQEQDESKGERVWFSRCILDGRLKHWVLITHDTKYELRRSEHVVQDKQQDATQRDNEYTYHIKPYTIDQEKRDISLTELLIPEIDGYYVCLIGWTRMSKEQIDAEVRAVSGTFGEYNLLRNNCQDFLRLVAGKILVEEKAADYPWFLSNTKTKYQKDQWLMPPAIEMLLRQSQSMQAQSQSQIQHQIHHQMQQQTQNQIQLQIQLQIQQQIQMQIQQQVQMQVQNSMMSTQGGGGA